MPPQATKDWLALLEQQASERGVYIDTNLDGRIFHFQLGENPGVIGKVRYSEANSREYENEQGQKHIWHRYNREVEKIEQGSDRAVVNITLDVWDKHEFDPDEHHFIFLTQHLIEEETYSKGDQKIWIEAEGRYSGPLAKYVDDWDAVFQYARHPDTVPEPTAADSETQPTDQGGVSEDTSGTISESRRTQVQVSAEFRQAVFDRFEHRCPLSGIEHADLLTVSHILGRAEHQKLAEDIENVVLLDWTHHMAFDAGLWTFDESGRIWLNPEFETASESLQLSLTGRHGEKVKELSLVADAHIEEHNAPLDWWPPR
jgi:hypothetical protein